ncbi:triple gene block protein 3 [Opuntia virus X]|uniref:Movement protein TGBp3 n=1 Tax=Opuntia virus X TaxID=253702 RepID=Q6UNH8_9VIRU|nr:triple gene block protein 3 [Opuntia virus X]AAR11550.1 triple gene block protein 3 [Opuntia virus X]
MLVLSFLVGAALGLALLAALHTGENKGCLIQFNGHSTIVSNCQDVKDLAAVINAINDRLSFSN